jgi:hypothetical protein
MARVLVFALTPVLFGLACSATQNPPDANENPDGRKHPKPGVTRVCTEMACQDAATIDTKLTAAGATLGKHEFALEVDGVAQTCSVEFTVATQLAYASCSAKSRLRANSSGSSRCSGLRPKRTWSTVTLAPCCSTRPPSSAATPTTAPTVKAASRSARSRTCSGKGLEQP